MKLKILSKLAFVLLMPLFVANLHAQEINAAKIKAAFLYNFAKYTHWPINKLENSNSVMNFCIIHNSEIAQKLEGAQNQPIFEHPIAIYQPDAKENLSGCHLIYLGNQSISNESLQQLYLQNSLVVSEFTGTGIISFVEVGNRIKFNIDLENAEKAKITLSSELLKLALNVKSKVENP